MELPYPKIAFTVSPNVPASLCLPVPLFLSSRQDVERLLAGTLVFRTNPSYQLQVLLLRRASSDSFALAWEIPCGGLSPLDSSPLARAVRQLWEETGLRTSHIRCPVGMASESLSPPSIESAEQTEIQHGDKTCLLSLWALGKRWHVLSLIVDVEDNLNWDRVGGGDAVRLRPEEHEDWMRATEDQIRRRMDSTGKTMQFVSEAAWRIILEGFRLRAEMDTSADRTKLH